MKLAILSRNSKLYSTRRLVEAARARGHRVRVLDPLRCYMRISAKDFAIHYKGRALNGIDAIVPRIGASITHYGAAVVRQFELMGCRSPNSAESIVLARDKLRTYQTLAAHGIDLPATVFGDSPDDTEDLLSLLGPPPHVIKLNSGTQGAGVMLTEKPAASQATVETLRGLYADFLVQRFIADAGGSDIRCFVIGDRVAAAMERTAREGDFRANLHRGAQARAVRLDARESMLAVQAAHILGLGVAGVDIVRSEDGPLILEVNTTPGLEGIESVCRVDLAEQVVDYITSN